MSEHTQYRVFPDNDKANANLTRLTLCAKMKRESSQEQKPFDPCG